MRLLAVTLASLVVVATAAAATSPKDVYRAAIIAAAAQKSVHYVATSNLAGNGETIVGDAAFDRGVQQITFRKGGTTGHVTVVVVASTAYVRGDAFTLVDYLGLTKAQAVRLANHWFFIKAPSGAFGVVAEAVRYKSFLEELLMTGPFTTAPTTSFAGKHATGVRATVKRVGETATIDLFVGDGSPLPLGQVAKGSQGTITTTLSGWNKPVKVVAPKGALAFR
jgi:hypothetical protein